MEMEKKENRENNVTKIFFERQLLRARPSSRQRKSFFEISSAASFHGGELKLLAKYRQINTLSCSIITIEG